MIQSPGVDWEQCGTWVEAPWPYPSSARPAEMEGHTDPGDGRIDPGEERTGWVVAGGCNSFHREAQRLRQPRMVGAAGTAVGSTAVAGLAVETEVAHRETGTWNHRSVRL